MLLEWKMKEVFVSQGLSFVVFSSVSEKGHCRICLAADDIF